MNPSQDQVKSAIRTLIASLGGVAAGWFIAKGWITRADATAILSNQQILDGATTVGIAGAASLASLAAGIWGMIAHKQVNLVATVAAMPEVAKVEATATHAGVALVQAVNAAGPPPGAVVTIQRA